MNPQETNGARKFPVAKVLGIILLLATAGAMAPMAVRLVEFRAGHSITDDAFIEARMVHVGSDGVSGRIIRGETDEGMVAKKGQVLFEIDADHYRDQVALAEAKARVSEDERRRQEIALEKLRVDVPLGVSEANRSLEMARISEAKMEKVLKLTADEVAGTLSESDALVGVAEANQVLARQEHERFTTLLKENATTLRRTQETARTNDSTKAELRLAEAKRQKAAAARSQVEVAAHDLEIARVATAKARLGVDIAENRNRGILEAQQALRIAGDAVDEAKALL
ncbi:MAG: biotin/lipoyl-binding protein, partial [Planctomycetota bacterium]